MHSFKEIKTEFELNSSIFLFKIRTQRCKSIYFQSLSCYNKFFGEKILPIHLLFNIFIKSLTINRYDPCLHSAYVSHPQHFNPFQHKSANCMHQKCAYCTDPVPVHLILSRSNHGR